ncbi:hypothetical protein B4U80_14872, partial [Leptotrombidium deliense]
MSTTEEPSYAEKLNPEIWLSIFSKMDLNERIICTQVCTQWRNMALLDVKKVLFVEKDYEEDEKEFINRKPLLRVNNLQHVAAVAKLFANAENVAFVGFQEPKYSADISENTVLKEMLMKISNAFNNLKRFKISSCSWNFEVTQLLLNKHRNIEKLTIQKCYVEEELDFFLCENFHKIHSFVFKAISEFTDGEDRFKKLSKQKLRRFHYSSYETDAQLVNLLVKTGAETLEILTLPEIYWVESLTSLHKFTKLKDLRLYFHMISENWWQYIVFPNLE